MINDFDMDIEDLESRLYSQVYHSHVCDDESQTVCPSTSENLVNMGQSKRYYKVDISSKQHLQNESNLIPHPKDIPTNSVDIMECKTKLQASDFFNINADNGNNQPQICEIENQISQIVHMISPYNNILVLSQTPTQIISNGECVESTEIRTNFEKYLDRQTRRQQKKQKKLERFRQKRKERKKILKEQRNIENTHLVNNGIKKNDFTVHYMTENNKSVSQINEENSIVTISDSDDSVTEIVKHSDLIILSSNESDDETENNANVSKVEIKEIVENPLEVNNLKVVGTANKNVSSAVGTVSDDDILFIDDIPKDLEVIHIDCDSKSIVNVDHGKINSDKSIDSGSTTSDMKTSSLSIEKSASLIRKRTNINIRERGEFLRTPDSTSNDFLDTVDLQQKRFNFGLHGSDFGSSHNFVKPKAHMDIYETESSCSASDNSTPIKNTVFHEIEFEAPNKELFSESNLETFGNYITPNRKNKVKYISSTDKFEQVLTKAVRCEKQSLHNNSDSSSESDYDGNKKSRTTVVKRKLPNLSSVDTINNPPEFSEDSVKQKKYECKDSIPQKKIKNDNVLTQESLHTDLQVDEIYQTNNCLSLQEINEPAVCSKTLTNEAVKKLNPVCDSTSKIYAISDDDDGDTGICEVNCSKIDIELANCKKPETITKFSTYYTNDMPKFYNTSWDRENFSVEEIQETMSDNQKLWKVVDEDRNHIRVSTPKGPRCRRCREVGHMAINCLNVKRPLKCSLCGQAGHLDTRCPDALCTLCGSPGGYGTYCSYCANWRYIQCKICNMYGHIDRKCPDLWRRYHLTTEPGPIIKPLKQSSKNAEDRWCSGCAKSGHYEYKCRIVTRSHHSVDPYVKEYYDVYNFPKTKPFLIHCDATNPTLSTFGNTDKRNKIKNNIVEDINTSSSITVEKRNARSDERSNSMTTIVNSTTTIEDDHLSHENFIFPPIEMIPPYFREQVTRGNQFHTSTNNLNYNTNSRLNSTDIPKSNSITTQTINSSTIKLNHKLFAFMHSLKGINFINDIRQHSNITLTINFDEEGLSGGTVEICGNSKEVKIVKYQIKEFFKSVPKLVNMPRFSKGIHNLLSQKFEKVVKTAGDCQSLYNNLVKLALQLKTGRDNTRIRKEIKNVKLNLNMILFGKFGLLDGQKHMDTLHYWQKQFEEKENYKVPLNILYDLFDSYSYIFSDTVNHNYQLLCGLVNNNVCADPSLRDIKLLTKYFRLAESKCYKLKMFDKLQTLRHLRNIHRQTFSVKAYREVMTFCHKLLNSMKT